MTFFEFLSNNGQLLAAIGAVCAAMFAGIGSAIGVGKAGQAGAAVISENPDLFGSVLVLQLLPGTQGIYGLLIGFVIAQKAGLLGASDVVVSAAAGMQLLFAALPIALWRPALRHRPGQSRFRRHHDGWQAAGRSW